MEAINDNLGAAFGTLALAKVEMVDGGAIHVRGSRFGRARARLALPPGAFVPRPGDSVLLGRADDGGLYIVGVVAALREVATEQGVASVIASDGTTAAIEDEHGREVLRVRDSAGRIMIEHRPDERRSVLHTEGDLDLSAAGAVRISAGTDLTLEARGDVRIAALTLDGELDGQPASALTMREGRTQLTTGRLGADIERADLKLGEANVVAGTLRTVARRVKNQVELLDTRADKIVEKARESWRETEGLSQSLAGRMRMVAKGAFQAIGESTLIKARQDVKIKGDKIHLG